MERINNAMKITIAVPVYGVEKYVGKCAESIFLQDYENLEILFINDCFVCHFDFSLF